MKDGIIRGEGNSRLLKSPATIPATFAEFRAALIAGTLPVDLLYNATGWDVQGTALNKANLLTDAVAEALGLESDDPTVSEALSLLADLIAQAGVTESTLTAHIANLAAHGYTAADVLAKLLTVDGSGSGLDADTVDGNHASAFATASQGAKADAAIPKGLATAANQLLVSTGAGVWGVQTKSGFKTPIISVGTYSLAGQVGSSTGTTFAIPHGATQPVRGKLTISGNSSSALIFAERNPDASIAVYYNSLRLYCRSGQNTYLTDTGIIDGCFITDVWIDDNNVYVILTGNGSNYALKGGIEWTVES
ncbi:MAG TPA: hypothetical protein VN441_16265 [Syntrophomonas sp.]|nr:hypothetical protein [Syntrophomonas sp.]